MKTALSILTDKKNAMMIKIYPDEDAANRSLEAPDALLADKGAKVRGVFHLEGPVGVWKIIDPS